MCPLTKSQMAEYMKSCKPPGACFSTKTAEVTENRSHMAISMEEPFGMENNFDLLLPVQTHVC